MVPPTASHDTVKKPGYKSPKHAQVWFLKRSRDGWKQKYQRLKAQSRRLHQHLADLTTSRQRWRLRAEAAERQLAQLPAPPQQPGAQKGGR